ncbi:hypothetical protein BDW72DRAFT_169012 [Aspergillus terricola var. indicus]
MSIVMRNRSVVSHVVSGPGLSASLVLNLHLMSALGLHHSSRCPLAPLIEADRR